MSALNIEGFRHKLAAMNSTQDSVQTMALWVTHHKSHSKQIVEVWIQSIRDAVKDSHRLTLMYLANDVIQTSKRKGGAIFKEAFSPVLEEAVALCRDESIRKNVLRIVTIWEERKVLDSDFCERLQAATVSTRRPKPKVDAQFLAAFNPTDVPGAIENLAQFEGEVELKRNQLNNLNLDVASMESISKLKDRAGGKRFSEQFEDGAIKLEEFVKLLRQEVEMRKGLIETLKKSEIFYEAQASEAKIVTNAYKNFSTRVGSLKKRLDEYKRHLPGNKSISPIPSPTVDAPSPGATPPEDPATDKVNTEDMDVSDEEGGIQHGSIMAVSTNNKRRQTIQRVQPPKQAKPENLELNKLTGSSFLTGLGFNSSTIDTPSPTGSNVSAPSPENSPSESGEPGEPDEPYEPYEPGDGGVEQEPLAAAEVAAVPPPKIAEPVKVKTVPPASLGLDQEAESEWLQLEAELEKAQAATELPKRKKPEPTPTPVWPAEQPEMSFYGSRTASPLVPYTQEDEGASSDGTKDGSATPLRDEGGGGRDDGKDSLKEVVKEATTNPIGFLSRIINRSQTSNSSSPKPSDSFMSSLSMLAKSVQAPLPAKTGGLHGSHKAAKTASKRVDPSKHPFGLGQFLANLSGAKPTSELDSEDEPYSPARAGYGSDERLQNKQDSQVDKDTMRDDTFRGKVDDTRDDGVKGGIQTFMEEVEKMDIPAAIPEPVLEKTKVEVLPMPPSNLPPGPPPGPPPPGPPPGPPPPDARRGPSKNGNQEDGGMAEGDRDLGQSMIMYEFASDDEDAESKEPQSFASQVDASSTARDVPDTSMATFTSNQSFMGEDISAKLESSLYEPSSSYAASLDTQATSSSFYGSPHQGTASTWSTTSWNGGDLAPSNSQSIGGLTAVTDSAGYDPTLSSIPGLDMGADTTNQPKTSSSQPSYNPTYAGYFPGFGLTGMDPNKPLSDENNFSSLPGSSSVGTMDPSQPALTGYNPTPVNSESYLPGIGLPNTTQASENQTSYSSSSTSNSADIPGLGLPTMDPTQPPPIPNQMSYAPTPVNYGSQMPGPEPPISQPSLYSPPISTRASIPPLSSLDVSQPPPTLNQTNFSSPPASGSCSVPGIPNLVLDQPPPPPPVEEYSPTGARTNPMMGYQPTPLGNDSVPSPLPDRGQQPPPSPGFYSRQNSNSDNSFSPSVLGGRLPREDNTGFYQPTGSNPGQSFPDYSVREQFTSHQADYPLPPPPIDRQLSPVNKTQQGFLSPPAGGDYGYQKPWLESGMMQESDNLFGTEGGFQPQKGNGEGFDPDMYSTVGTRGLGTGQGPPFGPSTMEDKSTNNNYFPSSSDEPTSPISVIRPRHPPNKSPRLEPGRQSSTIQILGKEFKPDHQLPENETGSGEENWDQEGPMENMFGDDQIEHPMVRPPHRGAFHRGGAHGPMGAARGPMRGGQGPMRHRFMRPPRPYRTPMMRPRGGLRPCWRGGPPRLRFPPRMRPPFGWR